MIKIYLEVRKPSVDERKKAVDYLIALALVIEVSAGYAAYKIAKHAGIFQHGISAGVLHGK